MASQFLLQGTVKWSYDHEMLELTKTRKILSGMLSGSGPLHHHEGVIALSNDSLIIEGGEGDEDDLTIPLASMTQLYLGFDDTFPKISDKGLGLFWQPLRIGYYASALEIKYIYLVIDFNGIYTHDKDWFNMLTQLLA